MPTPPSNETQWGLSIASVGGEVRELQPGTQTANTSTTADITSQQVGQERLWTPFTGTTAERTPTTFYGGHGWAIPLSELLPVDTRSRAFLRQGTWNINARVVASIVSGTPLAGTATITPIVGVWKLIVADLIGVELVGNFAGNAMSWTIAAGGISSPNQDATGFGAVVPEVVLPRTQTLLVQFGFQATSLPAGALSAVTYRFSLQRDSGFTSVILPTDLDVISTETGTRTGRGSSAQAKGATKELDASGRGASNGDRSLEAFRAFVRAGRGATSKQSSLIKKNFALIGRGSASAVKDILKDLAASGDAIAQQMLTTGKTLQRDGRGLSQGDRVVEFYRDLTRTGRGGQQLTRVVVYVRRFDTAGHGRFAGRDAFRLSIPADALPDSGATIIKKKAIYIFDD